MFERFNQLSFVIGVFFLIVAAILLLGYAFSQPLHHSINLYTGIGLLVFGVIMVRMKA